jgi:hypothetical protein
MTPQSEPLVGALASPDGLLLAQAFGRIKSADLRRRIVALMDEIADHDP